jgi:hypothetical protein
MRATMNTLFMATVLETGSGDHFLVLWPLKCSYHKIYFLRSWKNNHLLDILAAAFEEGE